MGWFDGFPFKSKEQMKREEKEYEKRIFPLGPEQRKKALSVLKEVLGESIQDEEKLYAYITVKDKFTLSDDTDQASAQAVQAMQSFSRQISQEQAALVIALVRLDMQIDSLEAYPSAGQVKSARILFFDS